jgi:ABC-type nickel/cobalt efflux system permease component RcnA
MFLIIHSITSAEKKNGNTDNIGSIVLIYFLLSYLSWKKKEHAKKKKYRKRKRKPNKQTHVLKEKHGQHIQHQGPKQTTRNAHAADKDVCK